MVVLLQVNILWAFFTGIFIMMIFSIYLFLIFPGKKNGDKAKKITGHIYAHRGLHSEDKSIPENSMEAFLAAGEKGYGIELDINISADGKVVVFHDDDLSRACKISRKVSSMTYKELLQQDIFSSGAKIPLFSDVIKAAEGKIPLIVEIKNTPDYRKLCEKTAKILDEYKGDYCIESFNPLIVRWFYKNRPDIVRGQISSGIRGLGKENPIIRFLLSALLFNFLCRPHFVAYDQRYFRHKTGLFFFRKLGGRTIAWTVRDKKTAEKLSGSFHTFIFEFFKP